MTSGGRKAKARRLQVFVAETLARRFNLTIEATPPTKPGMRSGVAWVPEGDTPDLRVRTMGQPGADVALLSSRSRLMVSLRTAVGKSKPIWWECKNSESWSMDAGFWSKGRNQFIERAFYQAKLNLDVRYNNFTPVVVLHKNNWPALAVWQVSGIGTHEWIYGKLNSTGGCVMCSWHGTDSVVYCAISFNKFVYAVVGLR